MPLPLMNPVVIPASTATVFADLIERCCNPTHPDDRRLVLAFVATLRRPTTLELGTTGGEAMLPWPDRFELDEDGQAVAVYDKPPTHGEP